MPRLSTQPNTFCLFAIVCVVLIACCTSELSAQFHEPFNGDQATWKRNESDCQIIEKFWLQKRVEDVAEADNQAEQIGFRCGPGTKIFVSHPVTPAFVIRELKPSLRIRSSKRGIQMGVRVVLPHTPAPNGEGPMTTLITGPVSKQTNRWETLAFGPNDDLESRLKTELWMLRGKFGAQVTVRDAFIDRVVLNLYTGSGDNAVEIDDLKLNGIVEATRVSEQVNKFGVSKPSSTSNRTFDSDAMAVSFNSPIGNLDPNLTSRPAQNSQVSAKQPSHIVRDGTVLLVRKRPFFPRIIEHNGENFDFLKALGFNTVSMGSAPTPQQLRQAAELSMWIVAPPPASVGLSPIGFEYDPVLAWSLGKNLAMRDMPSMQQRIREIRESDQRENRPTVANVTHDWSALSAQTDILSVGLEPLGTSFIASQYGDWIKQRAQSVASSKPVWADVQTELSPAIESQAKAIFGQIPPSPIEFQQVRFLIAEAISAGARGLRFRSRSRLDQPDPVTRLRALTCQYNNRWLTQIEPWLAGGAMMGEVANGGNDASVEVSAINTNRARLLLVQRPTHHEQYWAGDNPVQTISINDPDSVFTSRVYQLTDTDLKPLSIKRLPGGTSIEITDCPSLATIVMTEDPMVINGLMQSMQQPGQQSMFQMHTELTQQWLAIMQLVDRQMARVGRRTPASSGSLNEAVNALQTAMQLTSRNSPTTALPFLDRADERLAYSRREIQSEALGLFQSKSSTPLVAHCSLVPLHWQLAEKLRSSSAALNGLAGGDFENLDLMKRSGWENHRSGNAGLQTNVELAADAASDGQYGLKLTVQGRSHPNRVESMPVWVSSPKIRVQPNQLVRIHGWVNVPRVVTSGEEALMIVDSLGTRELAERIPVTQGWQEFTLYRTADVTTDFRVRFELNGFGVAMVDEVTVQVIDLSGLRRQANSSTPRVK